MERSIWSGTVSFGLVTIPVNLYGATRSNDVALHQVHKTCGGRMRQLRWCPECQAEISLDDLGKGWGVGKGETIPLTDAELAALPVPTAKTIQILGVVKAVDPLYMEKAYYLQPEAAGRKAYALFYRALADKGVAAIGRFALRTKETLVTVQARDGILALTTLYYADEVRLEHERYDDVALTDTEMGLATMLVEAMGEADLRGQRDGYREALLALVESKVAGLSPPKALPAGPNPIIGDLMATLRESIEAARKAKAA